jgi:predicted transcriptional regulator
VETGGVPRYIAGMAGISLKNSTAPAAEPAMTAAEREARAASIARARAQVAAGEIVPGDAVFEWLASWGTENELPPPEPSRRRT